MCKKIYGVNVRGVVILACWPASASDRLQTHCDKVTGASAGDVEQESFSFHSVAFTCGLWTSCEEVLTNSSATVTS